MKKLWMFAVIMLATTAYAQDSTRTATTYKLQSSQTEPVAIPTGKYFAFPVTNVPAAMRQNRNLKVRIFQGTRAELMNTDGRGFAGNCFAYDSFVSADAMFDEDGKLNLEYIVDVDELWLDQSRPRRYVVVAEDGTLPAGRVWIDKDSIAGYFGNGLEVEIQPTPRKPTWTPTGITGTTYGNGPDTSTPDPIVCVKFTNAADKQSAIQIGQPGMIAGIRMDQGSHDACGF